MSSEYDDDYPTCERTDVELRIYSGDAPPQWVTEQLGIKPTSQLIQGERHTNSLGLTRVTRKNAWFLSSEGKVASKDTRRHLDWLLRMLEPAGDRIRSLQTAVGVSADVNCIWWSAHGHGGPTISPDQMSALGKLGLELGFDIYFFGDDDEDEI